MIQTNNLNHGKTKNVGNILKIPICGTMYYQHTFGLA